MKSYNNVYIYTSSNKYDHDKPDISEGDAGGMDTAMKAGQSMEIFPYHLYEKIAKSALQTTYIPVFLPIPEPSANPAEIYAALSQEQGFLLESMEGVPKRAVRSIIGVKPLATLAVSDSCNISGKEEEVFQN